MAGKSKKKNTNGVQSKLNMRATLIMFALIPLVCSSVFIGVMLYNEASKELRNSTHNSLFLL